MKYEHSPFVPLIYMANECLDTSKALKSCEEIHGCFWVKRDSWSHLMACFLLFTVTQRPPKLVLKESCAMLFILSLTIEVTLHRKVSTIATKWESDSLHKGAIKKAIQYYRNYYLTITCYRNGYTVKNLHFFMYSKSKSVWYISLLLFPYLTRKCVVT